MRLARIVSTCRLILNGTRAAFAPESNDGLDALDVVERGGADLPVIVLTAQSGECEEKALDLGAPDSLTKPVETRSLVARVRGARADQQMTAQPLAWDARPRRRVAAAGVRAIAGVVLARGTVTRAENSDRRGQPGQHETVPHAADPEGA